MIINLCKITSYLRKISTPIELLLPVAIKLTLLVAIKLTQINERFVEAKNLKIIIIHAILPSLKCLATSLIVGSCNVWYVELGSNVDDFEVKQTVKNIFLVNQCIPHGDCGD